MAAPATQLKRRKDFLGKIVHNLVMVYDSGNDYVEFRVQCEIPLSFEEANQVRSDLANKSVGSLEHARDIVVNKITAGATRKFKDTISTAFQDNIEYLKSN